MSCSKIDSSRSCGPEPDTRIAAGNEPPSSGSVSVPASAIPSSAFAAKGSIRILPADSQQLNFLFARTDDGFYSLAFVADRGFTLFDYRSQTSEWVRIGDGHAPGLRLGVSTDFAVEGRGRKLVVGLDGLSWNFDLPRALPDGIVWGLGAQAGGEGAETGSAGLWQRITVLPAAR